MTPNGIEVIYPIDSPITDKRRLLYFKRFVSENYGDYTYVDFHSMAKENDGEWVIFGGVSKPYFIQDTDQEYPHLRYETLNEAFSIQLAAEENDVVLRGISRKNLSDIVQKRIKSKTSRYEAIVLDSVKDKLSEIPLIQSSHTPVIQIINNLDDIFAGNLNLARKEYSKWMRYFPLLEQLEVVKNLGDSHYAMGDAYKEFEKILLGDSNILDRKQVVEQLFGYVIQYGSDYLSQYLNLTASKPYISLTNTFYYYATKIGRDFKTSVENLRDYYHDFYRKRASEVKFKHWINQLQTYRIIEGNSEKIGANPEVYEKIQENMRERAPKNMGHYS